MGKIEKKNEYVYMIFNMYVCIIYNISIVPVASHKERHCNMLYRMPDEGGPEALLLVENTEVHGNPMQNHMDYNINLQTVVCVTLYMCDCSVNIQCRPLV